MHQLGIEPGSLRSQDTILPLDHWSFASSVVNTTLGTNVFEVPFVKRALSQVSFVTRPTVRLLWLLAFVRVHPSCFGVVGCERVRLRIPFDMYAILGDDVLITDE
ncbi:hypothetical protein ACSQ67_017465 [Phaseolus vulgaris]